VVQIQLNIHFNKDENKLRLECNPLKREDANEKGPEIAKLFERCLKELIQTAGLKLEKLGIASMTIKGI